MTTTRARLMTAEEFYDWANRPVADLFYMPGEEAAPLPASP
jgi:hypothetical protein